jgi:hypothetical protein
MGRLRWKALLMELPWLEHPFLQQQVGRQLLHLQPLKPLPTESFMRLVKQRRVLPQVQGEQPTLLPGL